MSHQIRASSAQTRSSFGPPQPNESCSSCHKVDITGDVVLIGGGIAGLYAAYTLLKSGRETRVYVIEKDARLGGRVRDHRFPQVPDVTVGLGAWRIDKRHSAMMEIVSDLAIPLTDFNFTQPSLMESRGVVSTDESVIKDGYPALKAHPTFGHMTSDELFDYLLKPEHVATARDFSTWYDYASHWITPQGADYAFDMIMYRGSYMDFVSPESCIEQLELELQLAHDLIRPVGGMSAITDCLGQHIEELGGYIYKSTGVEFIERENAHFVIRTSNNLTFKATKLIIGVPPLQFRKIKGSVATEIQAMPQFDSPQPVAAFKGAAVYDKPWWENVYVAGVPIRPQQKYYSGSDGFGITMVYRGKGNNAAGVVHTMYSDSTDAKRWRDIANISRNRLDNEVHRRMERKFGTKIPRPVDTVYKYWEDGWYYQKAGTPFSLVDISTWAKRPLPGQELFLVGEAYNPMRAWCEGAVQSVQNALREGWGLTFTSASDDITKGPLKSELHAKL